MTRAGRKPNPSNIRSISGGKTARRGAAATAAAAGSTDAPIPEPRWADRLPGRSQQRTRANAAAAWRDFVDELGHVLVPSDRWLLAEACVCYAQLIEAEQMIAELGQVVETEHGFVLSRWNTAANGHRTALSRYVAELGLSPASRARLGRPKAKQGDRARGLLS